jgi:hypothetical protein
VWQACYAHQNLRLFGGLVTMLRELRVGEGGGAVRRRRKGSPQCKRGRIPAARGVGRFYWSDPVMLRFGTNPTGISATSFMLLTSMADTLFVTGLAT